MGKLVQVYCCCTTSTPRSWASAHTDLGRPIAAAPRPRALSWNTCSCAGHNGRVPGIKTIAANSAAVRYSHFGFGPARKNTLAVSHRSLDVGLNAAEAFLSSKPEGLIFWF